VSVSVLVLAVACYAAVATAYLEARRRREAPPTWARVAGPATVALQFVGLVVLSAEMQRSPFATGSQAMSFLAFSLAALYLLLEATSRVATHGGGFYATAAVLAALGVPGLIGGAAATWASMPRDPSRSWHVGLALMSTAAVLASGLLAIGYLGTYARVKRHRLGTGVAGPSLAGFEQLARRASLLGVALLAPALFVGLEVAARDAHPAGTLFLSITTGFLLLILGGAFLIWWRRPLRGVWAAWLNLGGTVVMLASFALVHPLMMRGGP
jgi:hypothetical protein